MGTTTREMALRSWRAVARRVNGENAVNLNPATLVGVLLAASGGDIELARGALPGLDDSMFWARVRAHFDAIATEDMSAFDEDPGTLAFLDEVLA